MLHHRKIVFAFNAVLLLLLLCPKSARSQQQVQHSDLPHGTGFATEFSEDARIQAHRSVIFADNFETGDLAGRWDELNNKNGEPLSWVDCSSDNAPIGKRSLCVTADLTQNQGGGLTQWFPSHDQLFIRFYTKFHADCDYVHHFCTLRANRSLQGGDRWSGFGGAGSIPDGKRRFSTAIEPWGNWGKLDPPGKWNFYSYWHQMKPSPDKKYWGNSFLPEEQPNIERDRWYCIEFMLKHNTPNKADGEQAFWVDGQLRGHWQNINWRTDAQLQANAFTLESYVTDRWTKQQVNIVYFDNVVIAKEYIGPAGPVRR
jgi:hypothetical protein